MIGSFLSIWLPDTQHFRNRKIILYHLPGYKINVTFWFFLCCTEKWYGFSYNHCMNQIKSLLALYSISISKSYCGSLSIVFRELFIKLGTLQLHGPLLCGQIYTPVLLLFIHIKISSWIIYILIFFLMVSS